MAERDKHINQGTGVYTTGVCSSFKSHSLPLRRRKHLELVKLLCQGLVLTGVRGHGGEKASKPNYLTGGEVFLSCVLGKWSPCHFHHSPFKDDPLHGTGEEEERSRHKAEKAASFFPRSARNKGLHLHRWIRKPKTNGITRATDIHPVSGPLKKDLL